MKEKRKRKPIWLNNGDQRDNICCFILFSFFLTKAAEEWRKTNYKFKLHTKSIHYLSIFFFHRIYNKCAPTKFVINNNFDCFWSSHNIS